MPLLPSLLTQDVNHRDTPLCHLPGLSHLPTYTSPLSSPWRSAALRKPAGDPLSRQSQVRSAWGRIWRSREAESAVCGSQRDVNTDKTSWLLSWLQWKYLWFSPSAVFTLGLREIESYLECCSLEIKMECLKYFLRKCDETGGRGRLRRSPSKNPLLS